ncbi:hypothetical protein [Spongiactinospora sp. TRM90649]|uniref:hypothetical protein n=1 Tax=Spongiactinospora sp. TRM90649 TaxID=3031114 RepID=UPI0023F7C720|nr:hypothetical protein [Spongiactinospora sp. TRM90649]MDF5756555.1 hypothetical protein [Spongiactinospora sp. TRM90649]
MTHDGLAWGFLITRDHLHDRRCCCELGIQCNDSAEGTEKTHGSEDAQQEVSDRLWHQREGIGFRLLDSDGALYYEGRLIVPPGEEDGELLFKPLDWAVPYAGCATVQYCDEQGQWRSL